MTNLETAGVLGVGRPLNERRARFRQNDRLRDPKVGSCARFGTVGIEFVSMKDLDIRTARENAVRSFIPALETFGDTALGDMNDATVDNGDAVHRFGDLVHRVFERVRHGTHGIFVHGPERDIKQSEVALGHHCEKMKVFVGGIYIKVQLKIAMRINHST